MRDGQKRRKSCGLMRWRRVQRGKEGGAVSVGYGEVREAGRKDWRGGEGVASVREQWLKGRAPARLRVRVRERK